MSLPYCTLPFGSVGLFWDFLLKNDYYIYIQIRKTSLYTIYNTECISKYKKNAKNGRNLLFFYPPFLVDFWVERLVLSSEHFTILYFLLLYYYDMARIPYILAIIHLFYFPFIFRGGCYETTHIAFPPLRPNPRIVILIISAQYS